MPPHLATASSKVAAGSLHCADYRPGAYYWEVIELLRRTILTGWVTYFIDDERKAFLRLLVAVLVSIGVLMLTMIKKPYQEDEDHFLSVGAQLMLLISFCAALCVKAYEDVDEAFVQLGYESKAANIFGVESSDYIINLVVRDSAPMAVSFASSLSPPDSLLLACGGSSYSPSY